MQNNYLNISFNLWVTGSNPVGITIALFLIVAVQPTIKVVFSPSSLISHFGELFEFTKKSAD